jgi:glycosyltransferase involved in cell wall biosynthesis
MALTMPAPCPPRIGFNAALLSSTPDFRSAGIHRYIQALLGELATRDGVRTVAFVADRQAAASLPAGLEVRSVPAGARRPTLRIAWEQLALPAALARARVHLYHGAAYAMPLLGRVPAVVTVHDLSFFRMPETLSPFQAFYLRAATRLSVRRAAAVIAVSQFTADELAAVLGASAGRVHVVHNGCDPAMRRPPDDLVAAYRRRAGLPDRFVLAVGTLQPRKNLAVLLDAYAVLARRDGSPPPLVIAGAAGWGDTDTANALRRRGIEPLVRLAGYVPADQLPFLYAAATLMAFPSRYEGFGLPAVEAMACGTPVVAARAASLPEVCGGAACLVEPTDAAAWAGELGRLWERPDERARLSAAGLRRARDFSWAQAADGTLAAYGAALDRRAAAPARRGVPVG